MNPVYVASSWRNEWQLNVVSKLHHLRIPVYDFKHPTPDGHGFHWSDIDPNWRDWMLPEFARALDHRIAQSGFGLDMKALTEASAVILVLPCGRSAHLEAGWACGAGIPVYIYTPPGVPIEPELMYLMTEGITDDLDEIIGKLLAQQRAA